MINVADYIGIPFEYGGRGPSKYDCYGLVMELYKRVHDVDIKDVKSPSELKKVAMMMSSDLHLWKQTEKRFGAVVLFKVKGLVSHVGFVIHGDKFIHTWDKSGGVVIEKLADWEKRIIGFYEYVG